MIHLYHYNTKNTISQLFKEFSIFCGENLNNDNLIICDLETYKFINFQLIPFYKKYKLAKNNLVDQIKNKSAELIDLCEQMRNLPLTGTGDKQRLISLAQTEFESGAMWAVKANFTD